MSDNWIVQNLNSALQTWSDKLAEIWTLLTQSPENFKGGAIWSVMTNINGGLKAIGYGLLVLFFAAGLIKTCGSFTDMKKPEHVVKAFIRFALAQGAVMSGMELLTAIFSIVQGIVTNIMSHSGMAGGTVTELPSEIVDKIEAVGMLESIPLWIVTLLGSLLITVLSFVMILTVYGRMFKLYMYTAIAPIPLATFAGEPTQSVGKNFIRSYAGVCLEGAIIALACIIFSVFASSPPAIGDTSLSAVTIVWNYVGELVFNLLVLVGAVKASDRIVKEIMGLQEAKKMEEPKTLSYDWQYGREELFLRVDSYMSDDNLYIGLYHMEDGYPESFADLTVNLPFAPLGGINEAYIDHNFSKEKLRFIKQHKLGTIQPDTASSGYCIFQRVAFDLKKLAELDPEGTKRFMERNGIRQRDVPKQKQKKKQRLQRER